MKTTFETIDGKVYKYESNPLLGITLDQVFLLNKRIGDTVYALDTLSGNLVAASVSKRYIREHHLNDMINSKGELTDRAIRFAKEILS